MFKKLRDLFTVRAPPPPQEYVPPPLFAGPSPHELEHEDWKAWRNCRTCRAELVYDLPALENEAMLGIPRDRHQTRLSVEMCPQCGWIYCHRCGYHSWASARK